METPAPERRDALEPAFAAHARAFREAFGAGAGLRQFFSPGRVNLMGAHLDYNGGPVMPTAIDRGTFVALRPRPDRTLRLASVLEEWVVQLDLDRLPEERQRAWADYPLGVVLALLRRRDQRGAREPVCGLDVLFGGNLAVGAGLSSSASICVGTALALDRAWGLELQPLERVQAALEAEREFVGVQCGIMDPYSVGLARPGHLLWLDCKDATSEHLPLDLDVYSLAVADTGVRRALATGDFNRRVAECQRAFELLRRHQPEATCLRDVRAETFEAHRDELEAVLARRAEHVVREVERTFAARAALLADRPDELGRLMTAAHHSLRELYEVSCPELDQLVEDANRVEGVLGGRLTGAGFGGCAVFLLHAEAEQELRANLRAGFEPRFGRAPEVAFFVGDRGPREISGADA